MQCYFTSLKIVGKEFFLCSFRDFMLKNKKREKGEGILPKSGSHNTVHISYNAVLLFIIDIQVNMRISVDRGVVGVTQRLEPDTARVG